MPHRPRLLVVVGPTGAGKSTLALELARRVGAEVVSADSQQVYRGMDIGTGKIMPAERGGVRHHLLDVLDPDQEMTAARFVELADDAIAQASARGASVVVVGGTMLYVRALLLGLFEGPAAQPALRAELEARADEQGLERLWQELSEVDPDSAARIHPTDKRRIIRALEVLRATGIPLSEHHRRHDHSRAPARYPALLVGLFPEVEALYRAIDARVEAMLAAGLLDEVFALRARGYGPNLRSQQAIGYAELHRVLDGDLEMAAAVALIKRNSRRYARRQRSWYRNDRNRPDDVSLNWVEDPSAVDLDALERYLRSDPRE